MSISYQPPSDSGSKNDVLSKFRIFGLQPTPMNQNAVFPREICGKEGRDGDCRVRLPNLGCILCIPRRLMRRARLWKGRWGKKRGRFTKSRILKSMLGFDGLGCRYMRDKRLLDLARESSCQPGSARCYATAIPLGYRTNIKRAAILPGRGIESCRDFPTFPEFRVNT